MPKKRRKWIIVLAVLAALSAIGVTLGFMFKKTNAVNTFIPAQLSCTVHEMLDDAEVTDSYASGNKKSDIQVQNTGNVPAYLRVRLVSYFVDAEGSISGAEPSVYPEITLNSGWLAGENHTYYYTKSVEPNGLTPVLCEPFTLSEKSTRNGEDVYTVYQVVEVSAEAIQAAPASAAEDDWAVTVTDGIITAVG